MNCANVKEYVCQKLSARITASVANALSSTGKTDNIPFCLFLDNENDKSNSNYYEVLKKNENK